MKAIWACAQIDSRDAYRIPRALASDGALAFLMTDFWNDYPRWFQPALPASVSKARRRFHPELEGRTVLHLGLGQARFELTARARKWSHWTAILQRNAYFQRQMLRQIGPLADDLRAKAPGIFLAYSYAAARLFTFFKKLGWYCVLYQADAAMVEEQRLRKEADRDPPWQPDAEPAPEEYWSLWRTELQLADCVAVPSDWVAQAVAAEGVPAARILPLPAIHEGDTHPRDNLRAYPTAFTKERPLQILVPGPATLRLGLRAILEAARALMAEPVRFEIADTIPEIVPPPWQELPNVRWRGNLIEDERTQAFRDADLLLFPPISEAFGTAQLEAQIEQLPVLASRSCGEVVQPGVNGDLIDPPAADAIVAAIRRCLHDPGLVERWSRQSTLDATFTLSGLRQHLYRIEARLEGMETAQHPDP